MNKRNLILVAVAVAGLLAFFLLRDSDDADDAKKHIETKDKTTTRLPFVRDRDLRVASFDILADDDSIGTLRLEGQVVDATEDPVEGAEVTISSNPRRTATTGEDGSFFFDKVVGRPYTLVARTDEGAAGPLTARLTATSDPIILRLRPAPAVRVTVLGSADRRPVSGATVELRGLLMTTATTNAEGVATIRGVAPGFYQVAALASGFATSQTRMRIRSASTTYDSVVLLKRGAPVTGIVRTKSGSPVEGAQVIYRNVSDRSMSGNPRFDAMTTGADGKFSFAALPEGTFRFASQHKSYAPGESDPITLAGNSAVDNVEIEVEEGAVLAGRVTSEDGQPAAFAAVRVSPAGGGRRRGRTRPRQAFAGEDGRFEMQGLPRKVVLAVALHERATSETLEADLEAEPIQKNVEMVLGLNGVIAGQVVDTNGEPVDGAQVRLRPDFRARDFSFADMRLRGMATEVADAGGRFEFRGLADMAFTVMATPPGSEMQFRRGRGNDSGVEAKIGDTEVRVVIEARGAIVGKVAFPDGSPVTVFSISMGGRRSGATPFSNKDGKFKLGDLEPGSYSPNLSGPDFDRTSLPQTDLEAGREVDIGTVTVSRGRRVAGRVLGPSGQAVANATVTAGVTLRGSGAASTRRGRGFGGRPGGSKSAISNEDGEFVINGLGSTSLVVVAEHESMGRSTALALMATTDSAMGLELNLLPPGAAQGTITVNGQPADSARVTAQSQNVPSATFSVRSGSDGKYRFDKLAPDDYLISARVGDRRSGMAASSKETKIKSGSVASVNIAIDRGSVTLVVRADGDGVNMAMVHVVEGTLSASSGEELEAKLASRSGGFSTQGIIRGGEPASLENLKPGAYSICIEAAPSELNGREAIMFLRTDPSTVPVFCASTRVAASPEQQEASVAVTVPALPTPPSE